MVAHFDGPSSEGEDVTAKPADPKSVPSLESDGSDLVRSDLGSLGRDREFKTFDLSDFANHPGDQQAGGLGKLDDPTGKPRVVTARGTEDGFVLRIDGKAEWETILAELESMLGGRQRFFEGGEVLIEWLDRLPTKEQSKDLGQALKSRYGIGVTTRRKRILHSMSGNLNSGEGDVVSRSKRTASTIPLFDGDQLDDPSRGAVSGESARIPDTRSLDRAIELSNEVGHSALDHGTDSAITGSFIPGERLLSERAGRIDIGRDCSIRDSSIRDSTRETTLRDGVGIDSLRGLEHTDLSSRYLSKVARILGNDILTDDEANAKVLFGTLRSGQRIETPFSLVVIGDVNPGADIIAGGDIAVLGSLRGTAHAAAYDDDSFDRVIIALQMQPMQLRIGSVISRGSDETSNGPEIARIDNRRIVVEPYNARGVGAKKKSAGW